MHTNHQVFSRGLAHCEYTEREVVVVDERVASFSSRVGWGQAGSCEHRLILFIKKTKKQQLLANAADPE